MKEEIAPLIRELAQELGVATEYLWSVMVSQASVYVLSMLIALIFLVGVMIIVILGIKSRAKKHGSLGKALGNDNEVPAYVLIIVLFIITVVTFMSIMLTIQPFITALLNPEYWALEQILDKI